MNTSPLGVDGDRPDPQRVRVLALRLQARAGAQVEDLLVHRRGDRRRVALRADDAARHHVRAAVRVELLDGVDAVVVRAEERDLLAADEGGQAPLALEVGDRHTRTQTASGRRGGSVGDSCGRRRSRDQILQRGHRRTARVVPAMSTRGFVALLGGGRPRWPRSAA